jgi:glycerol-3-phosphate dehydrogenase
MLRNDYQVAVIGGGINGTGVAREAASRGYSTLLVEKKDFGHATSGQSSKNSGITTLPCSGLRTCMN